MPQRKSKRVLIYFFLLILVGSINNININNLAIEKVKNIKISGLDNAENKMLLEEIKRLLDSSLSQYTFAEYKSLE